MVGGCITTRNSGTSSLRSPTIQTQLEEIQEAAAKGLAKIEKIDFNKLTDMITDEGLR